VAGASKLLAAHRPGRPATDNDIVSHASPQFHLFPSPLK
jgi:hypothetical protein